MKPKSRLHIPMILFRILLLCILIGGCWSAPVQAAGIPRTGDVRQETDAKVSLSGANSTTQLSLDLFVSNVVNGNGNQIVGVYQEKLFAQKVVQQPASDPTYVSPFKNQITQFGLVSQKTGNLGLLAHNYLSGTLFFDLSIGDVVQIVFGDGRVQSFSIQEIRSYQALTPKSVQSDFIDLDSGTRLSADQLFQEVYGGDYHLTLQTCIQKDQEASWGRLFIVAVPVD